MRTRTKAAAVRAERPTRHALTEHLGSLGAQLDTLFDFIEVADTLLNEAGIKKGGMNGLFPGVFLKYPIDVYRHHARELVDRMVVARDAKRDPDLELGTRAEVLLACMNSSLNAPLTREATAVYETLFSEILPAEWAKLGMDRTPGRWPTQIEEDIEAEQRRLRGKRAR